MEPYQKGAFWYSKLNDFRKCARYYKFKHIDGLVVGETTIDLEFGTAMHGAINDVLQGGDGITIFRMYWESVKAAGLEYGRYSHEQLETMAEILIARFIRLYAKHFKPFKMEERMHDQIGPYAFEGTPDFLGDYKGVPSVVDFKTAAYRYDKLKIQCDDQMPLYAQLAKQKYGFEAKQKVYVVFIKDLLSPSIQFVQNDLYESTICDTIENVIDTCADISNRQTFPKNSTSCVVGTRVCPMFEKCWGAKDND